MTLESRSTEAGDRLVLLGTKGGPRVAAHRANPANLLVIGGVPYVIDCGYGVTRQLVSFGLELTELRTIFITHHHADHNLEYGNLIYSVWARGLTHPVDAYGPIGLERMTELFLELNAFDIRIRMADENRPDLRKLVRAHDVLMNGEVFRNDSVTVTAFQTPHPPIYDNFAYKFETKEAVIVFSSDTEYNPRLAEFASGADILVHEALYEPGVNALVARIPNAGRLKEHLMAAHTTTEDVGRIAAQAGVKTLVLSHFVPGDDPNITDAMWAEGVRKHYAGRVIVGADLMSIPLSR
ncbi:MAG: MBL fold metallo-hydrolase [Propylenella sp.]